MVSDILILLATFNGAPWLPEQLSSIVSQSHRNWRIIISDDGSQDATQEILRHFATSRPRGQVQLLSGPGKGATSNFRNLLRQADLRDEALAFCDQDDIWHPDHLERGLKLLSQSDSDLTVAGGRMQYCDAQARPVGLSPLPRCPPDFRNALVQNVLSGNTMLLSPKAARLLQKAEAGTGPLLLHDWWAYQLITGAGGLALYDPRPNVFYRQHGANVIGSNRGISALPRRLLRHLSGSYGADVRLHLAALENSAHLLTEENRQRLKSFTEALNAPLPRKIAGIRAAGIRYQSWRSTTGFWLSVALGRL